ncbi:MAG: hypothetical protein P1P87_09325, partial [Trueperaceae bacterium]|nr:hypothetical protein [Trueperaceae bacterium]
GMLTPPALAHAIAARGTAVCPTLGRDVEAQIPPRVRELEQRLAEARERVRRAMGGDASASTRPSGSVTPPTATARPAAAPAARPALFGGRRLVAGDRDDGLLSTPLASADVASLGRERPAATRPTSRSTRFAESPALQVERPVRAGRAAVPTIAGFPTDPATVRSALIWHQVLGEPRARRPLGGRSSTLRSR